MKKAAFLSLTCITLAAILLLAACGGSDSDANSDPDDGSQPRAIKAQGIYFGNYRISGESGSVPVYGAVLADGYAYFGGADGALYVLPSGMESGPINGDLTAYAPIGEVFPTGDTITTFSFSGNASDDGEKVTKILGEFSGADEDGQFTINYKDSSTGDVSLNDLVGIWQGYYWGSGSTSIALSINPDGAISGDDGYGCHITGQLDIVSGYKLLKATVKSTGNFTCAGTLTGAGFIYPQDLSGLFGHAEGTYIYVGVSNGQNGFTAELYK